MDTYRKDIGRDIEGIANRAKVYLESSEGEKTIREALRQAQEITARLNEARRVDPKTLHDPITL